MRPSEFFELHPQEFWWLVEAWNRQDENRTGKSGLSKKDIGEMKALVNRAKAMHERGEWDPKKGFARG